LLLVVFEAQQIGRSVAEWHDRAYVAGCQTRRLTSFSGRDGAATRASQTDRRDPNNETGDLLDRPAGRNQQTGAGVHETGADSFANHTLN